MNTTVQKSSSSSAWFLFPGNFFSDVTLGTDDDGSLQAANSWPLKLPPGLWPSIAATVMVWTFLVALVLDVISGDQVWSGLLSILLAYPRPFGWCLEVGRNAWCPLATSPSRHLPQMFSCLRGLGWNIGLPCELDCLQLAKRSTTWVPQHLNNLWQDGSPKLHSWSFLPLDRASG